MPRRREYIWVYDLLEERVATIGRDQIDFARDTRLGQSETLKFSVPAGSPKSEFLIEDVQLEWNARRYYIRQVEKTRVGADAYLRIEADALWYRLGEDVIVGSYLPVIVPTGSDPTTAVPEPETLLGGLQGILDGSGWTIDADRSDASDTRYVIEEVDASRLALLRRWATVTSRFLQFDTLNKTVTLALSTGVDRPASFRYARNLQSVVRRSTPPEATVLYPYGRDGLSIAGINGNLPYLEDFSYYTGQGLTLPEARALYTKKRVWRDDKFLIDTNLLEAAEVRMVEFGQPFVAYECKVSDLAELIGVNDAIDLNVGDRVRVWDEPLNIDFMATVVRILEYPLEPWRNEIELSNLPEKPGDTSSTSRGATSQSWNMFKHDSLTEYQIRNGGSYLLNRIGLNFRDGGEAVFGYDVYATGVGTGSLSVSAFDAESNDLLHRVLEIPYTDGQVIHENLTWAMKELAGQYDVRIRMIATATGGPDPAEGVDLAEAQSRLWILAYGAVQQTPTAPNSVRFDFTGADQFWTVPDGVHEVRFKVAAAAGGGQFDLNGKGGIVYATAVAIPGTNYLIEVGGQAGGVSTGIRVGRYPDGGDGGLNLSATAAYGGGARSAVRVNGTTFADSLIVAGGGGGENASAASCIGGDGGFYNGDDAFTAQSAAGGATQFAAGAGNGSAAFGQGGDASQTEGGFRFPGGGGGGGWYGGAANDSTGNGNPGGPAGGGGSGWIAPGAGLLDLFFEDGANGGAYPTGHGYVEISWEDPL